MEERIAEHFSAIILAGGRSSRMGKNKAMLLWRGKTLLEYQTEKVKAVGIRDIVIAGEDYPVEGTRPVCDIIPGKGPLSGLHAGLTAAKNRYCLVLGVDTPLVTKDVLCSLIREHDRNTCDVTVLGHGGKIEPLIGIYNWDLRMKAEEILHTDKTAVRRLFEQAEAAVLE